MRPTNQRELLYPVLPAETYRKLGITPPSPPGIAAHPAGPLSAAGTPYLSGTAVTGPPPPHGVVPNPPPPPQPAAGHVGPRPAAPPNRPLWIIAAATAIIIAIIVGATGYILAVTGNNDEDEIRAVIAAETTALNTRDLSALLLTRCAADRDLLQQIYTPQSFGAEIDSMIGPAGSWVVTVDAVTIDTETGTATADQTSNAVGSTNSAVGSFTDTVDLRLESGNWLICVASPVPGWPN